MIKPELLAPAGNLEKLEMAVRFGADAVYLGGKSFGLRAGAGNFSLEEMAQGVKFAHENGAKVYVAVNIFAHNEDLVELGGYLDAISSLKADGVIVSDPGVFRLVKSRVPDLPIHISTQANNTNWSGALFWQEMGAKRIVLARELSFQEIREISRRSQIELEAFVHGSMCISYSGRCLLSNYLTGRNANKGDCAHPCRWNYRLVEEKRPGQYFPVLEDERGTYIFNSKDLCLIEHLPDLIQAGVGSFKIEGRMKSAYYVATVVKVYREAIDTYWADPESYSFQESWREELAKVSHRHYTTGFALQKPSAFDHRYDSSAYIRSYDFVGVVLDYLPETGEMRVEQRNRLAVGDEIEIVPPQGPFMSWKIPSMKDDRGEFIEAAPHPQQVITIPIPERIKPFSLLRRAE
ncbi:peptidase U32 family protein [Candidatus Formimonas warabiya]|uniref:Peptidase U32 n=1 Tax=Formimonas warabiya TaxID=1761012 RepID=A0A3G1KND8_FORW1|nr:U32 family peptidase [Candidatus Formimonas warabiya]ATW23979.1 peptidase U32 [Candidatus Formimonas warabiya]